MPVVQSPAAEAVQKQIGVLAQRAEQLLARIETGKSGGPADMKALKAELETTKDQLAATLKEKETFVDDLKSIKTEIETIKAHRDPTKHEFYGGGGSTGAGQKGLRMPFSVMVYRAKKYHDQSCWQALDDLHQKSIEAFEMEGKAIGEGINAGGGFLVPPTFMQQLVALRRASSPLRDFVQVIPGIRSDLVYVPTQTAVEQVGWTAENAMKPSTDEVFGQIATNIFTLAGIAKISNQLLEDSSPAVDTIVQTSLGRGVAIEEDRAMINGSGTGQPTGILSTAGIVQTAAAATTAASIYDDILAAIGRVQAAYFGQPDAILMAPRTWSKMQTAKDSAGRFLGLGTIVGSQTLALPGVPNPTGSVTGAVTTIFGIPVVIDANVPTTLGDGTQSVIIVGAFKEAWLMERDGMRMDMSSEAGTAFEQNQTWFRGEERVGFTAARLPNAFQIVTGETA